MLLGAGDNGLERAVRHLVCKEALAVPREAARVEGLVHHRPVEKPAEQEVVA
jgi:hypothetical protein